MIKRWEIYLVNFNPSRWSEQAWIRPALVIQNDVWNEFSSTVIVSAISSKIKNNPTNIIIQPDIKNNLTSVSVIKTSQLLTIDKQRLISKIWKLSTKDIEKINFSLKLSLWLN